MTAILDTPNIFRPAIKLAPRARISPHHTVTLYRIKAARELSATVPFGSWAVTAWCHSGIFVRSLGQPLYLSLASRHTAETVRYVKSGWSLRWWWGRDHESEIALVFLS